jgi:hypothetical protein
MPRKGASEGTEAKVATEGLPKQVSINYIKTNVYHCYHVDGVFGGIAPHGKIYGQFFVERSVLGISQAELSRLFRVSPAAVMLSVRRGEGLVKEKGYSIEKLQVKCKGRPYAV